MTTSTGENVQVPSLVSEIFVPDQLIAGRFPLVTAQGAVLTGAAALKRGTVLGQVTIGAAAAAVAGGGNTGNGVISAIALGAKAKVGTYTLHFTGATAYDVINPAGQLINKGYAVGAYVDAEIGWTFTAGGTPMAAGDTFTIAVAAGSNKFKKSVATATDGSQVPNGILIDDADATGGDVSCGVYLAGEFNGASLVLDASWSIATVTPPLRASSIFVRTAVSNDDPS